MAGSVALETHDAAGGNLFFARAIYGGDFIFLSARTFILHCEEWTSGVVFTIAVPMSKL